MSQEEMDQPRGIRSAREKPLVASVGAIDNVICWLMPGFPTVVVLVTSTAARAGTSSKIAKIGRSFFMFYHAKYLSIFVSSSQKLSLPAKYWSIESSTSQKVGLVETASTAAIAKVEKPGEVAL